MTVPHTGKQAGSARTNGPQGMGAPRGSSGASAGAATCRQAILTQVSALPVFPAIAGQILNLIQNPESPIRDIVRLAELDPGLTASMLRAANSAYFAGARSIGSLQEAAVRLGARRLSALVMLSVTAPLAKKPLAGYELVAGRLLEHSIAVGVGVEALAGQAGAAYSPRHGFTAGVLHDLGKTVLATFVQVDLGRIMEVAFEGGCSFEEAEARVLGIDHAETGALLLQHWQLPDELVRAVRHHHNPEAATPPSRMADLVHVADQLALEAGIGTGIDGLQYRTSTAAVERINLNWNAAQHVMCTMVESLGTFRELLQQSSGGTSDGA